MELSVSLLSTAHKHTVQRQNVHSTQPPLTQLCWIIGNEGLMEISIIFAFGSLGKALPVT